MATFFWPASSPDLLACDIPLWGHLNRKVSGTRSTVLHNLTLIISEEKNAVSPVNVRVMGSVYNRILTDDIRRVVQTSLNEGKYLFFTSH